jgi:hypothetical protein
LTAHVLIETLTLWLPRLFAACCAPIVLSWWIHIPYYRRLLRRLDPAEYQWTGGWTFFSSAAAPSVCTYFLKREFLRSDDIRIRRHGSILRWTFSVPAAVATLVLPLMMVAEIIARAR